MRSKSSEPKAKGLRLDAGFVQLKFFEARGDLAPGGPIFEPSPRQFFGHGVDAKVALAVIAPQELLQDIPKRVEAAGVDNLGSMTAIPKQLPGDDCDVPDIDLLDHPVRLDFLNEFAVQGREFRSRLASEQWRDGSQTASSSCGLCHSIPPNRATPARNNASAAMRQNAVARVIHVMRALRTARENESGNGGTEPKRANVTLLKTGSRSLWRKPGRCVKSRQRGLRIHVGQR